MAQDFEQSMQNADDFLAGGLMNFKKQNNMDTSNELAEYRSIAQKAFSGNRYSEARKYYQKVLDIVPMDYEAMFYAPLCKGLSSNVTDSSVEEVFQAYNKAIVNIPTELDWDEIIFEFAVKFADYVINWFKKSHDVASCNAGDWYTYNISQFYEHADRSKKAVDYMDSVMPLILRSDMDEDEKEYPYGFWYCSMCRDFCCETMYYTVNDRDLAITSSRYVKPLGYPVSQKAAYIQKYDDMCFEIRKFDPSFNCIEDEWDSGFDRTNPPTTYEGQQQDNRTRRIMQIQKDREIEQKLSAWRSSGGPAKDARDRKIRKYMSTHSSDRIKYQEMKGVVLNLSNELERSKKQCDDAAQEIVASKDKVSNINMDIQDRKSKISKLEKKIFGKAKAKVKIAELNDEILGLEKNVEAAKSAIQEAQSREAACKQEFNSTKAKLQEAQRECDMFINNCII